MVLWSLLLSDEVPLSVWPLNVNNDPICLQLIRFIE